MKKIIPLLLGIILIVVGICAVVTSNVFKSNATETNTAVPVIIMLIGGFLIMIGLVNIFVKDYMKPEDNV